MRREPFFFIGHACSNWYELKYLDQASLAQTLLKKQAPFREIKTKYTPIDLFDVGTSPISQYKAYQRLIPLTLDLAMRGQAEIRALRILNALQTHATKDGKTPTLAELGLPAETTVDPFNGQPLIVKRRSNGWLIYSVVANLKDDGGKVLSQNQYLDIGIAPPKPLKTESSKKTP